MRVSRMLCLIAAVLACSRGAGAQTPAVSAPLARFVTDLLAAGGRVDSTAAVELGDFLLPLQLGAVPSRFNQSLGLQLATTPFDVGLETSKPGFEAVPAHYGFGPSFTMHAGAIGRGKTSVSFNYQNVSQGSIDGIGLDSFKLGFVLTPPPSLRAQYGREAVQESLALRLQQDVASFGLVYGVTDRLDVGVGVPIVHVEMEGQVRSQVFGPTYTLTPRPPNIPPDAHFFDVYPATPAPAAGCSTSEIDITGVNHAPDQVALFDMVELASRVITRKCKASGLGDVVGHVRYRVTSSATNAIAVGVDARLPTGDADQLLGTGGTRATASVVWTGRSGRFLPHASAGYTYAIGNGSSQFNQVTSCVASSPSAPSTRATTCSVIASPTPLDLKLPSEINLAGGTDMVFYRRLTIAGDLFARLARNLTTFTVNDSTASALLPGDPTVPGTLLQTKGTNATLLVGVAAAQVALTDRTVLKANLMFPVGGDGLSPRMAFGAGLGVRY